MYNIIDANTTVAVSSKSHARSSTSCVLIILSCFRMAFCAERWYKNLVYFFGSFFCGSITAVVSVVVRQMTTYYIIVLYIIVSARIKATDAQHVPRKHT